MKIVVLAGGLSPERDVSFSSGTMACNALLSLGHKAILVDLFFGLPDWDGKTDLFEGAKPLPPFRVSETEPDLDALCQKLFETAYERGSSDNISLVLVRNEGGVEL